MHSCIYTLISFLSFDRERKSKREQNWNVTKSHKCQQRQKKKSERAGDDTTLYIANHWFIRKSIHSTYNDSNCYFSIHMSAFFSRLLTPRLVSVGRGRIMSNSFLVLQNKWQHPTVVRVLQAGVDVGSLYDQEVVNFKNGATAENPGTKVVNLQP